MQVEIDDMFENFAAMKIRPTRFEISVRNHTALVYQISVHSYCILSNERLLLNKQHLHRAPIETSTDYACTPL